MTKKGLERLILDSTDDLYRVAKSVLREDADCEDAVSEAIVKAFSKYESLRNDQYAKTWMTRILLNECYSLLRKRKREVAYDDSIELAAEVPEDHSDLYEKMTVLEEDYRVPIVLYYMNQLTIKEIARVLDMKESAVKMRLSRGRIKLRSMYEKEAVI